MYYHLIRNLFYHQLLSAIQVEIFEPDLPRSELDNTKTSEQSRTRQKTQVDKSTGSES